MKVTAADAILAHCEIQTMLGRLWCSIDGIGSVWGLLRSLNRLERSSQGRNPAKTGIDTYPGNEPGSVALKEEGRGRKESADGWGNAVSGRKRRGPVTRD